MNEIRFSQPVRPSGDTPKSEEAVSIGKTNKKPSLKKFGTILIGIVVVALLALGVNYYREHYANTSQVSEKLASGSDYYAFFLTNGQVYFGKLIKNTSEEMAIANVYYIQAKDPTQGESTFKLIKLGNELHGPTDMMYINRAQVIFYEQLRKDSKVVESIMNQ